MWLHIKNSLIVKVLANDVRILFQPPTYRIVFFNPKYRDQRIHTSYILNRFKRNFVVVNFQFLCPGGGGVLGLIFAGYMPLSSQSPYPI